MFYENELAKESLKLGGFPVPRSKKRLICIAINSMRPDALMPIFLISRKTIDAVA
jgi:hypothetical protein